MKITATWNPDRSPETKLSFDEAFVFPESDIAKADFLKDVIDQLQEHYDGVKDAGIKT